MDAPQSRIDSAVDSALSSKAARGVAHTFGGQIVRMATQAISVVVLARLLTPSDFGLMVVIATIIGFGELFRDFGLSQAAIQAKTLSRAQRDNLFIINVLLGSVLALALFASAGLIANLFGDDRLLGVAKTLSTIFVLNSVSAQARVDLTRRMRFGQIALVETVIPALALGAAIHWASAGWGYWALVYQQLLMAVGTGALLLALAKHRPGLYDFKAPMGSLFRFGINSAGVQVLVYLSRSIDRVILAWSTSQATVGIYDRAYQILMLPLNQINTPAGRVAIPVPSRLYGETERYSRFLFSGHALLVNLVTAIFAFSAFNANRIIPIVLGDQWDAAIPLFQILAVGGFAQAASYSSYWIFVSQGRANANLKFTLATRPLMILLVILGAYWGAPGIAAAWSVSNVLILPLSFLWVRRYPGVSAANLLGSVARSALVYGVSGIVSCVPAALGPDLPMIALLAFAMCLFLTSSSCFLIWRPFRDDVKLLTGVLSKLGPQHKG